jgi:hypothetical protein
MGASTSVLNGGSMFGEPPSAVGWPQASDCPSECNIEQEPYFNSSTSFSLPLLISSIFLISPSVSF